MREIYFLTLLLSGIAACNAQGGVWMSVPQNNEIYLVWLEEKDENAPVLEVYDSLNTLHPGIAPEQSKSISRRYRIYGLIPGMRYHYRITRDSKTLTSGQFRNAEAGRLSFSFVAGACSFLPENPVYKELSTFSPLFSLILGDIHYGDVKSEKAEDHLRMQLYRVLSRKIESDYFSRIPLMYTWDDHDFCGNNSGGPTPCGMAAREAFKKAGPHIELNGVKNGIHQHYTFGRVRFVLPDLRSSRTDTSLLDKKSWKWLIATLDDAVALNQVVFLVSSVPWMGDDNDSWGLNPNERQRLAIYLEQYLNKQVFILCGDAHMAGLDKGLNSNFSGISHTPGPPVAQIAALIGFGSFKGGTYSEGGAFLNPLGAMQYGFIKVIDGGGNALLVQLNLYRKFPNQDKASPLVKAILPFRLKGNSIADSQLASLPYPIQYTAYSINGTLREKGIWYSAPEELPAEWRNNRYFVHFSQAKTDFVYAL